VNQRALIDKVLARYSGKFTGQSVSKESHEVALVNIASDQNSVSRAFTELG